jgi:hypothetical protein
VHILIEFECQECKGVFLSDIPLSQAAYTPYTVDASLHNIYGEERAMSWFGLPMLQSLRNPKPESIDLRIDIKRHTKNALLINCIDYLYGHSLLKLLNVDFYFRSERQEDIIVIIPESLRWLVPEGVAEIWSVAIPFSRANNFYPDLDKKLKCEFKRFVSVSVAKTISHPKDFSIQRFTNTPEYDLSSSSYRITFIWREDRLWTRNDAISKLVNRLPVLWPIVRSLQNVLIRKLFSRLRTHVPDAIYTVAGLGKSTLFPEWIEDKRCTKFTAAVERDLCTIYSQSRLVIGIHGSNLLLPSALGGITMDLMPHDRWGNIAQDIILNEDNSCDAVFRYRFLPQTISVNDLAIIALSCFRDYAAYRDLMHDSLVQETVHVTKS